MVRDCNSATHLSQEEMAVRKGPWTAEEDSVLFNYVNANGEGNWNSVARSTGLKRSGKSCRLRWLNYLRPSVRRGNITLQEQLLILELHFRWGNRWSKIAQFLPGRTDNEIKNYWRTRVQKQAKQLNCDVNSQQFRDAMRFEWMPRLLERIQTSAEHKPTFSDDPTSRFTAEDPNSAVTSYESSELLAPPFLDFAETERCDLRNPGGSPSGSGVTEWESDIQGWLDGGDSMESFLNDENICFLRQQLCDDEFSEIEEEEEEEMRSC